MVNVERPVVPEPMDVQDERNANRDMEQSDSDSSMEDENPPPPIRHNWPMGQPRFNPFVPGLVAEERFGGTGHRLGGKEMSGDSNSIRIQKALVNGKFRVHMYRVIRVTVTFDLCSDSFIFNLCRIF